MVLRHIITLKSQKKLDGLPQGVKRPYQINLLGKKKRNFVSKIIANVILSGVPLYLQIKLLHALELTRRQVDFRLALLEEG